MGGRLSCLPGLDAAFQSANFHGGKWLLAGAVCRCSGSVAILGSVAAMPERQAGTDACCHDFQFFVGPWHRLGCLKMLLPGRFGFVIPDTHFDRIKNRFRHDGLPPIRFLGVTAAAAGRRDKVFASGTSGDKSPFVAVRLQRTK